MDKQQARELIGQTFTQAFDYDRFHYFTAQLLNHLNYSSERQRHWAGQMIKKAYSEHVNHYERIGTYTDPEGRKLDVLVIHLKKDTTLERGRTLLRNFAADYLSTGHGNDKDAVLVAYVSKEEADWRFSYVKLEYALEQTETDKVKERKELTPARRYSFLVGENEKSHTAQKQFLPLLENDQSDPLLSEIEEAFKIEKVTKEFFEQYKLLFDKTQAALETRLKRDALACADFKTKAIETDDFSKKLLGQIVFLYFLQKKGWFGVARDAAWGSGQKDYLRHLFSRKKPEENYFNDVLEPLFYDTLAREREGDYAPHFRCKIPFLNGGLFEAMGDYDWVHADLLLPDELFSNHERTKDGDEGTGILDVFDRYNFTVNEAEPLETEVAVDPEMLGKVFENLLPENLRHKGGTYYTPRVIVNYMCQQSLINYLAVSLPGLPREDIETLIIRGEVFREFEASQRANEKNVLPESIRKNAKQLDLLLADITVCDPAIGSGAFLVGMMQEIVKARLTLASVENMPQRTAYELKRHAIENSLYGVDIDPSATEIARLRLWLSLVVDELDFQRIQPLPNLDYKIMQGNSLLEEFAGVKLFDDDLLAGSSQDTEAQKTAIREEIIRKQNQLIELASKKIPSARELKAKFGKEIEQLTRRLNALSASPFADQADKLFRDLSTDAREKLAELKRLHKEFFEQSSPKKKKELRQKLEQLEWEFMELKLEKSDPVLLKELAKHRRDNRKSYFLWKLHFVEVFQAKGGFDVVIANPPYGANIDSKDIKPYLKKYPRSTNGIRDLYKIFMERGIRDLCRQSGSLCFITPNTFLTQTKYHDIRKVLLEHSIGQIINLGDGVFEQVVVPTCVTLVENKKASSFIRYFDLPMDYRFKPVFFGLPAKLIEQSSFLHTPGNIFVTSYKNRRQDEVSLGEIMLCKDAGVQYAAPGVGRLNKGQAKLGERLLYSGNYKENPKDIELLVGNDISRWHLNQKSTNYLRHNYRQLLYEGEWLHFTESIFDAKERIVWRQTADKLIAAFDTTRKYFKKSVHAAVFVKGKEKEFSYLYILALLNSKYVNHQYYQLTKEAGRIFPQVKITQVKLLPIKVATMEQQLIISKLVGYILFLKTTASEHESRDQLMISYFEQIIDALVYELYLPDEIHTAGRFFFTPLVAERLPALAEIKGNKLCGLRQIFERLFHKDHVVRQNIFFLDTIESIRIIEGKA